VRTPILLGLVAAVVANVALGAGDEPARSKDAPPAPQAEPTTCGRSGGVDVTVALAYNRDNVGSVPAAQLDVGFREPLKLPKPVTPEQLRSRLTSLLSSEYRVAPTKPERAGTVRVALTTSETGIPPGNAFKLRFDCPNGSPVRPSDLTCTTGEVVDAAGLPMPDTLARQVRCLVVQIAPASSE
jgi:hypothetical protein